MFSLFAAEVPTRGSVDLLMPQLLKLLNALLYIFSSSFFLLILFVFHSK